MKYILLILSLSFTLTALSQDPMVQKGNESLEAVAITVTKSYSDQLELRDKQFELFKNKVEEFLIREENIHKTFKGKEKLDKIYKLREAESMEMRNILTQPQYNLYLQLKPQIQPIAVVKNSD